MVDWRNMIRVTSSWKLHITGCVWSEADEKMAVMRTTCPCHNYVMMDTQKIPSTRDPYPTGDDEIFRIISRINKGRYQKHFRSREVNYELTHTEFSLDIGIFCFY